MNPEEEKKQTQHKLISYYTLIELAAKANVAQEEDRTGTDEAHNAEILSSPRTTDKELNVRT